MTAPQSILSCLKCHRDLPRSSFDADHKGRLDKRCRECRYRIAHPLVPPPPHADVAEEWRAVIGYEGIYEVSNLARVRRGERHLTLHKIKPRRPHWVVHLSVGGKMVSAYVHVLVARAFLGPCPEGHEVNHIDGDGSNSIITNLEYLTHAENVTHAVRNDLLGAARLLVADVRAIRRTVGTSAEVARAYGVSARAIRDIRQGRSWRALADEHDDWRPIPDDYVRRAALKNKGVA